MIKIEIFTPNGLVQFASDLTPNEIIDIIYEQYPDNTGFRLTFADCKKEMGKGR